MSFNPDPKFISKSSVAECPSCGEEVRVLSPKIGQHVNCPKCKMLWEVIWLEPVELDWPYLEDDDEEYADYDQDDDFGDSEEYG
jgi:lysine biosynthesis protein LysW